MPDVQFAALPGAIGEEALYLIEERWPGSCVWLRDTSPTPPTEAVVILEGTPGTYPHPYAYLQSLSKPPADEASEERLYRLLKACHWLRRAGAILFVNPKHMNANRSFDGEHLANFNNRLIELLAPFA